ncbi:MAG: class I SAM-dependent methyltransferase [Planctomycetota bacterium]
MDDQLALLRDTDVYLIDQILRGRVPRGARVADVGCGDGRNLPWFVSRGHEVLAIDLRRDALVALLGRLASLHLDALLVQTLGHAVEDADLPNGAADLVISNAVLHFAEDDAHFDRMLEATWRLVSPGGFLFARLASSVGVADAAIAIGGGRYHLPDGSTRYLVDDDRLLRATERMGGVLLDPIKTTVVQGMRAMATWVVGRPVD